MQNEHSEEDELVRAAQTGNREAFAQLYEGNINRVYHYLLGRLGQPADAEDVAAEVFIRAMEALPSYQLRGLPFVAWLFRIAPNQAVNHVKKQSRRKELPLLVDGVNESDDPAEAVMAQASSDEVCRAMEGLTQLQRRVLKLRFIAQFSIAETAESMKRSEVGVKFLQHSALRALKRIMRPREGVGHDT